VTSIIDSFILPYGAHDDIQFGKYWVSLGDGEYIEIAEESKRRNSKSTINLVN
jgi:hypothetical protein